MNDEIGQTAKYKEDKDNGRCDPKGSIQIGIVPDRIEKVALWKD